MKNMLKKITVMIILIIITVAIPFYSKAAEEEDESSGSSLNMTQMMNAADDFLNKGNGDSIFNKTSESNAIDTIYYIGLTLGIVIAVIIGMVLGIQFITSGIEGQAKVKEKLIPYVVGCFVVFGAFGIWRIVYNVLNSGFAE